MEHNVKKRLSYKGSLQKFVPHFIYDSTAGDPIQMHRILSPEPSCNWSRLAGDSRQSSVGPDISCTHPVFTTQPVLKTRQLTVCVSLKLYLSAPRNAHVWKRNAPWTPIWTRAALRGRLLVMNMHVAVPERFQGYLGACVAFVGDHWVHWYLVCPDRNQKAV